MTDLLESLASPWTFLFVVFTFGLAPGLTLRSIVLLYPPGDARRKELIAELYAVPRIERPVWVAQQLETALFEGIASRRSKRAAAAAVPAGDIVSTEPTSPIVEALNAIHPVLTPREAEVFQSWLWASAKSRRPVSLEGVYDLAARNICVGPSVVRHYMRKVRLKYDQFGRPTPNDEALFQHALDDGLVRKKDHMLAPGKFVTDPENRMEPSRDYVIVRGWDHDGVPFI